jgi:hypothetical protein
MPYLSEIQHRRIVDQGGALVGKLVDVAVIPKEQFPAVQWAIVGGPDGERTLRDDVLDGLNPAAIQRQIQALTADLLTLTTSKSAAARKPSIPGQTQRASTHESTKVATRAS